APLRGPSLLPPGYPLRLRRPPSSLPGTLNSNAPRGAGARRITRRCQRMYTGKLILSEIRQQVNLGDYRKKHWEGSFEEYLDIVREHPEVTRTAYQRLYDMILSHGTEEVYENKEKVVRYKFFTEFAAQHGDAIYGLDRLL